MREACKASTSRGGKVLPAIDEKVEGWSISKIIFGLYLMALLVPVLYLLGIGLQALLWWAYVKAGLLSGASHRAVSGWAFHLTLFVPIMWSCFFPVSLGLELRHRIWRAAKGCLRCGYDLAGIDKAGMCCPECGRAIRGMESLPREQKRQGQRISWRIYGLWRGSVIVSGLHLIGALLVIGSSWPLHSIPASFPRAMNDMTGSPFNALTILVGASVSLFMLLYAALNHHEQRKFEALTTTASA